VERSERVSGGNFASLTDYPLVRKVEVELSRAKRIVPAPVDAPIPARPTPQSTVQLVPDLVDVQLSANEYEALGLIAVTKGTTPQHLLRKVLRNFLVEFVEQGDGSRY
jgi:hypothetical protein